MPLFRCNGQIYFFAHVPKCAGQSVEAYLEERFGSLALLDDNYYRLQKRDRWTRTSPQHLDIEALGSLIPSDWIEASFAVVRNPFSRVVSAYNFEAIVRKTLPPRLTFEEWYEAFLASELRNPFAYDNHLRPQNDLVPLNAEIFRLEDGLDLIVDWLDKIEGQQSTPRTIPVVNSSAHELPKRPVPKDLLDQIARRFAADFERFGYSPRPEKEYLVVDIQEEREDGFRYSFHRRTKLMRTITRKRDWLIGRDRL